MKKIISYLLILTILATSLLVAFPTITVSAESSECVAPTATNGGGECHAPVLTETEEYPAVKNGGNYIYDVADLKALASVKRGNPCSAHSGDACGAYGNYETFVIQNDLVLSDENHGNKNAEMGGFGTNFSHAIIDGKNTDGRTCTIHFDNAKCIFGWGRDVTIRNLVLDGYSVYDSPTYQQHVGPLYMHGIDYDCTIENVTSKLDIKVTAWTDMTSSNPANQKIGGVISKIDGSGDDYFNNVVFEGSITVGTPEDPVPLYGQVGGIVGTSTSDSNYTFHMTECHNKGAINIYGDTQEFGVGGLIGYHIARLDMVNCSNTGDITLHRDASNSNIGGIIGHVGSIHTASGTDIFSMLNCHNEGDINILSRNKTEIVGGEEVLQKRDVTVKEVTTPDVQIPNNTINMGGLVGTIQSNGSTATVKISKCSNKGNLTNANATVVQIGGILGYTAKIDLTVEYCTNGDPNAINTKGNISSQNVLLADDSGGHCGIGGIIGDTANPGDMTYKRNTSVTDITQPTYYTASISKNTRTVTVSNCANYGKLSLSAIGTNLCGGGILGRANSTPYLTMTRCLNYGTVDISKGNYWSGAGGILGDHMTVAFPVWVNDSDYWTHDVDANGNKIADPNQPDGWKRVVGRFEFGWSNLDRGALNITNCYNLAGANITGGVHAGGIVGGCHQLYENDFKITIENCTNDATISAGQNAGGIIGMASEQNSSKHELSGSLAIRSCANTASVTSTAANLGVDASNYAAGGILGVMWGDSESEIKGSSNGDKDNQTNEFTLIYNCANKGRITCANASGYLGESAGRVANVFCLASTQAAGNRVYGTTTLRGVSTDNTVPDTATPGAQNRWVGSKSYVANIVPPDSTTGYGCDNSTSGADTIIAAAKAKTGIISSEAEFYEAFKGNGSNGTAYATGAYYLTKDITLTRSTNTWINSGVFYGNGHTVNFNGATRMFDSFNGSGCAVYDLKLTGTINSSQTHVSPLSWHGANQGPILSNIHSSVTINYTGTGACGGILSKIDNANGALIAEDLIFDGKIVYNNALSNSDGYGACGGIFGYAPGGGLMVNCQTATTTTITVTGGAASLANRGVGGIAGHITADNEIRDCVNGATITVNNGTNLYVGGIVGSPVRVATNTPTNLYIYNSHNKGASINGGYSVGGLVGGYAIQNTSGIGSITIEASTNKANLTGTAAVGGLVGSTVNTQVPITITNQCANTGTVQATAGYAGGAVAEAQYITLSNVANTGNVTGTTGAGGLVGNSSVSLTIDNSVNRGDVTANNNAGGIVSNAAGTLSIVKTANGGNVTSSATSGTPLTAGGIVAHIGTATSATINNCANSGTVKVNGTAASATDTAITAAGILGISDSAAVVNNCINMGKIMTGGATPTNSAYPISNPTSTKVTTTAARTLGNVYRAGTVSADNVANYTLSTQASGADIKNLVANFWEFDVKTLEKQKDLAINVKTNDGIYTEAALTGLEKEISESEARINADWTDPDNWVYQSATNTDEDQLVSAMNFINNSGASYIVYIPPEITPDVETEIKVTTDGFNYFSDMLITFVSSLKLKNTDTPEDTLTYKIDIDGEETASGTEITHLEGRDATGETRTILATVAPVEGENIYVAGTYKDTVNFVINYTEITKGSYEDE